jgi:hypothetical protein
VIQNLPDRRRSRAWQERTITSSSNKVRVAHQLTVYLCSGAEHAISVTLHGTVSGQLMKACTDSDIVHQGDRTRLT